MFSCTIQGANLNALCLEKLINFYHPAVQYQHIFSWCLEYHVVCRFLYNTFYNVCSNISTLELLIAIEKHVKRHFWYSCFFLLRPSCPQNI